MTDKELIISLGGPAKVARMLGYEKWGTNRVANWLTRGIPARVKLEHPHIFLIPLQKSKGGSHDS